MKLLNTPFTVIKDAIADIKRKKKGQKKGRSVIQDKKVKSS